MRVPVHNGRRTFHLHIRRPQSYMDDQVWLMQHELGVSWSQLLEAYVVHYPRRTPGEAGLLPSVAENSQHQGFGASSNNVQDAGCIGPADGSYRPAYDDETTTTTTTTYTECISLMQNDVQLNRGPDPNPNSEQPEHHRTVLSSVCLPLARRRAEFGECVVCLGGGEEVVDCVCMCMYMCVCVCVCVCVCTCMCMCF